jgi:threonine dehydrogenase-like Zn-dependent dehydrogenase
MNAVRIHGIGDYRLEDIPVPTLAPGDVLVRVIAAGICAGDPKTFHGSPRVWGSDDGPRYIQPPVTSGHEFVGEVVALRPEGQHGNGLRIGDWAVSEQIIPCGTCRFCRTGSYWMCRRHDIYGYISERAEGAWAEYMRFPAGALNHVVPDDLHVPEAAIIEPLACAIHAVERADIQFGDCVVIAGMGPIGLCMLRIARLKNPHLLIALETKPIRLEKALDFGADKAINPLDGGGPQQILELTDGYGCDKYIEAAGTESSVRQGLGMLRSQGTMVEFGVHSRPACVDWSIIGDAKELTILGSHLGPHAYPKAIRYLQDGTVRPAEIVSHTLPLASFEEGLRLVGEGTNSLKVLLIP